TSTSSRIPPGSCRACPSTTPGTWTSPDGEHRGPAGGRMVPMSSKNLTRDEARGRASFLSTDAYEIRLDLTTDERTFRTETTLRVTAAEARETFLDLIAEEV